MKPHKWEKEIKAWADGAEIEYKSIYSDDNWVLDYQPDWDDDNYDYRIKPQPKEPQYLYVYGSANSTMTNIRTEPIQGHKFPLGKIKLEQE